MRFKLFFLSLLFVPQFLVASNLENLEVFEDGDVDSEDDFTPALTLTRAQDVKTGVPPIHPDSNPWLARRPNVSTKTADQRVKTPLFLEQFGLIRAFIISLRFPEGFREDGSYRGASSMGPTPNEIDLLMNPKRVPRDVALPALDRLSKQFVNHCKHMCLYSDMKLEDSMKVHNLIRMPKVYQNQLRKRSEADKGSYRELCMGLFYEALKVMRTVSKA